MARMCQTKGVSTFLSWNSLHQRAFDEKNWPCRAVARSENPGGLMVLWQALPAPLVEIGLTVRPKLGELKPPLAPPLATALPWNYQSLLFNPLEGSKARQSNMHFVLVFLTIILSLTPKSFGCHWLQTVLFMTPVLQLDLNIKVWERKIL